MVNRLNQDTLTEQELKVSYWYITHKLVLKNILFFSIVIFNVLLALFIIWRLTDNYILKWRSYDTALQGLTLSSQSLAAMSAQSAEVIFDMDIGETLVFMDSNKKVDIITEISNSNSKYAGYFEYRYQTLSGETNWRKAYLFPGQTKFIHEIGFDIKESIFNASIDIRNFKWEQVLEYEKLAQERLRFSTEDTSYIPSSRSEVSENISISKVESTLYNNSAFTYRQVGLLIVLYRGTQIVGVNLIKIDNVQANESYNIEAVWFSDLGVVQNVVIQPEVNILDSSVFKAPR